LVYVPSAEHQIVRVPNSMVIGIACYKRVILGFI
jgi:hypothetical protein